MMVWNELKLIFRRVRLDKTFSVINIIGLSIGLTCSILAFIYIQNELRVDKHFTNTEDIYRMALNNGRSATLHVGQPAIFTDEILTNIPEVHSGLRLRRSEGNLKVDENRFSTNYFMWADSNFFSFLGWNLIAGNPAEVIAKPYSLVISESQAKQLFNEENPIGKIVNVDNAFDLTITGVFKDFPEQSHIIADFIAPFSTLKKINTNAGTSWGWHGFTTYLKLKNNNEVVCNKIADLWNSKSQDRACTGPHVIAELQPFDEIYLRSGHLNRGVNNIYYVIGIGIIAAFILIISCFNFINLSLAIQFKRSGESGVKKILGANFKVFLRQVFFEVSFYLLIALFISYIAVSVFLPFISDFTGKDLEFSVLHNFKLSLFILGTGITILLVNGIFPVWQMLNVNPIGIIKGTSFLSSGKRQSTNSQGGFRNTLVLAQFTLGIMLIISSIMVNKQLKLIRQHDAGFNKEQIISIENYEGNGERRYSNLLNLLKKYPDVKFTSAGSNVPADGVGNWGGAGVKGDEENMMQGCGFINTDFNYLNTIGAELIQGRFFDEKISSDRNKIVINESMAKILDLKNPIGLTLDRMWEYEAEIIGVVKDIEFNTIHDKSYPVVFFCKGIHINYSSRILVKLESKELSKTIAAINKDWNSISPEYPMNYYFLDDLFQRNYQEEAKTATILNVLTVIAISLCCMGLFGLALFSINARIKEIGVRKVNGAKTIEILSLINKDFVRWIITAYLIAIPVSSYFIFKWLDDFAYRTSFPWWAVGLTGVIALAIALITVSWQSWRAANRNPVEALKYE